MDILKNKLYILKFKVIVYKTNPRVSCHTSFLGGLRVTNPTIRLMISVCPSVRF